MKKWIIENITLTLIVAIMALGLSFFSFLRSCSTESELKETNYALYSIEHRPRLKFSNPRIDSLALTSEPIPIKQTTDIADSIGNALVRIGMKLKIKATNIGNSAAKIVGWAIADTLSNQPILKNFIKDRYRKNLESNNDLNFPHLYEELTPFDSCIFELKYSPQFIIDNKFIIHIVVFYENEIEQLFDTYYWISVNTNEIILPNPIFFRNNPEILNTIKTEMLKIIDIKDENNYSTIYSEKQKIELNEYLKQ
jgi:hypothetical protein